jgi:hypothetical protein
MNRADFLIAMSGRFTGGRDETAALQLLDVAGQSTVCDIQAGCHLIHVHIVVLKQKIQDVDAHIGAERFEQFKTFGERSDV